MKAVRLRGVSVIIDKHDPYFAHDRAAIFQVLFAGNYDRILDNIHDGDVVLDAGANIGCFSLLAARKVGDSGLVISVEPGSRNYRRLISNIDANGFKNVIAVRAALDRVSRGDRLFREGGVDGQFDEKGDILVRTTTITEVLKDHSIKDVACIKMDIEGAEQLVFQESGIDQIIDKVDSMAIEVHSEMTLKLIQYLRAPGQNMKAQPVLMRQADAGRMHCPCNPLPGKAV